jgi:hypothetical protein
VKQTIIRRKYSETYYSKYPSEERAETLVRECNERIENSGEELT